MVAASGVAMLLVVAGCSSEAVSGEPASQSSLPVPSTATSGPSVANPLSVEKVQNDMCSGLTTAQLTPYLGAIRKQEPNKDLAGTPFCGWSPKDGNMADATLYADSKAGDVADLYARRGGDNFFEKGELILGYPAVRVSQLTDGPKRGDCMTIVAVSDRARILVSATTIGKDYQYYTSMCTVSDKLAEAAVGNLKAGG